MNWARGLDECGKILQPRGGHVYVLPGNHESATQITGFCQQFGFHDFHGKTVQLGKYHIAGLGYSSPTPFNTPGEYSEAELAERLAPFAELTPLILICHAPPYGTALDCVRDGLHAGSRSVREFVERNQPDYLFCGHIHEAEGTQIQIGKTQAINVGKRGYLLKLD